MKVTIEEFYCDRCGRRFESIPDYGFSTSRGRFVIEHLASVWGPIDICPKCVESFSAWFEKGALAKEEEGPNA